jgi:DNA-binding transcriptional MerR regulator
MFPGQGEPGFAAGQPVFTSGEVSRMAGITLRQLQWWDERKVVSPAKEDRRRVYRSQEVLEVLTVSILRHKGLPLQKIRRVLARLRREMREQVSNAVTGPTKLYVLTDGSSVHLDEQPARILDRLADARRPMYVVCLSDQMQRIASAKTPRSAANKQLRLF